MKHIFVLNPAAGNFDRTQELTEKINGIMNPRGVDYEIFRSHAPFSVVPYIRHAYEQWGELRVYACGGDGTLNECITAAAYLDGVAVTNYPCGTGNDFIRLFGADSCAFYDLAELIDGGTMKIDIIKCNDKYAVNVMSTGFDARIASDMQKFKRLPAFSKSAYNLSIIYNLFKGITRKYTVFIDDECYEGKFTLIAAFNGSHYGGGFNAMPDAQLDDGLIDFLLVRPANVFTVAGVIGKYAAGRYKELPDLIIPRSGKKLRIICNEEGVFNTDGEIFTTEEAHCEICQAAVQLIVPNRILSNMKNEAISR